MTRIQKAYLLKRVREDEWHDPWYKEFRSNYLKTKKREKDKCGREEEKEKAGGTKEK
jgi:hypothetical protein